MVGRLLIIGHSGFIGSYLASSLISYFDHILGINSEGVFTYYDSSTFSMVADPQNIFNWLDSNLTESDTVLHCAGAKHGGGDFSRLFSSNVLLTMRIAKICREKKIRKFLYLSSDKVYQFDSSQYDCWISQYSDDDLKYAVSKKIAEEKVIEIFGDSCFFVILRVGPVLDKSESSGIKLKIVRRILGNKILWLFFRFFPVYCSGVWLEDLKKVIVELLYDPPTYRSIKHVVNEPPMHICTMGAKPSTILSDAGDFWDHVIFRSRLYFLFGEKKKMDIRLR